MDNIGYTERFDVGIEYVWAREMDWGGDSGKEHKRKAGKDMIIVWDKHGDPGEFMIDRFKFIKG
jgi:hypothetical protein